MLHTSSFNNIVKAIYNLPVNDKIELKNLLEHNIADARRDEIFANYQQAKAEHEAGKLTFSADINKLMKTLV